MYSKSTDLEGSGIGMVPLEGPDRGPGGDTGVYWGIVGLGYVSPLLPGRVTTVFPPPYSYPLPYSGILLGIPSKGVWYPLRGDS